MNSPRGVVIRDWSYFRRSCCHVVIAPLPFRQQTIPTTHEALFDHREPTQSVCVADCSGFTVCLTYSDVSLTMYINQWYINVELPYLWYIVVLLSDFEGVWVRRWLFVIIEGQGRNPCLKRAPAPERFFPRKWHRSAFKLRSKKVENFTLLLVPSDRKSIQNVRS